MVGLGAPPFLLFTRQFLPGGLRTPDTVQRDRRVAAHGSPESYVRETNANALPRFWLRRRGRGPFITPTTRLTGFASEILKSLAMMTPDFPDWAGGFAHQLRKLRSTAAPTLHQFEMLFTPWIAHWRLAQQDEGEHSRKRRWNLRLVFWTFLWQVAQAGASCREAIRQAQALCKNAGCPVPPATESPYCQARGGPPRERLQQIHDGLCAEAQEGLASKDLWCGHHVLVADGSCVTAPDTPANQKAFPQQKVQKPGCSFPIIRLVALLSSASHRHAHRLGNWQLVPARSGAAANPVGLFARW